MYMLFQQKRKIRNNADYNEQKGEEAINERHTLKKKRKRSFKPNSETEKDNVHMFTPENGYKCSIILSEINRKMGITSWRP